MATEYQGLFIKFGANTAEFDNSVKGVNSALGALRKDVTSLNKQLKFDPDSLELLTRKADNFRQQIMLNEKQLERVRGELKNLDESKLGTDEWIKLKQEEEKFEQNIIALNGSLDKTESAMRDIGDPQSIRNLDRELSEVAEELDIVNTKLKLDPSNIDLAARQTDLMARQVDLASQKFETAKKNLNDLANTDPGDKRIRELALAADKAEIELLQAKKAMDGVGDEAEDAEAQVRGFGEGVKAGITGAIVNNALQGLRNGLSKAKEGLKEVVSVGAEFEAGMSRVGTIAGASKDELEQLTLSAKKLGAATSFSASEAAAGMENLASAGFTTNEILAATPGLLDLAAVSGGDVAASAEVAASSLRAFGLDAGEAGHVADVFARAAADTNAEVADMGEAMKYVAPAAHAAGIALEESAAAIGIMSDAGIKGSQAGTSLRGALSRLAKPTKAMDVVMDDLGLSFYDAQGKMLPLKDQVGMLQGSFEGLTDQEKQNALVTLYGQQALSGMLALIDAGPDKLGELTESFNSADGAAADMAAQMKDNLKGAAEEASGAMETLQIAFFDLSLAPALKELATTAAQKLGEFAEAVQTKGTPQNKAFVAIGNAILSVVKTLEKFGGWIADHKEAIASFTVMLTGVASALLLLNVSAVVTKLLEAHTIATTAAAAAQKLFNLALEANPIVKIAALIITLVAAFAALMMSTDEGRQALDDLKKAVQPLVVALGTILAAIMPIVSALGDALSGAVKIIANLLAVVLTPVLKILTPIFEVLGAVIGVLAKLLSGSLAVPIKIVSAILEVMAAILGKVAEVISGVLQPAIDAISKAFQWFYEHAIKPVVDIIKKTVMPVIEGVSKAFSWLAEKLGIDTGKAKDKAKKDFAEIETAVPDSSEKTKDAVTEDFELMAENVEESTKSMLQDAVGSFRTLQEQAETWMNATRDTSIEDMESMVDGILSSLVGMENVSEQEYAQMYLKAEEYMSLMKSGNIEKAEALRKEMTETLSTMASDAKTASYNMATDMAAGTDKAKTETTKNMKGAADAVEAETTRAKNGGKSNINEMYKGIGDMVEKTKTETKGKMKDAADAIGTETARGKDTAKMNMSEMSIGLGGSTSEAATAIKNNMQTGVSGMTAEAAKAKGEISAKFSGLAEKIKGVIGDMASIGRKIVDDIVSGLSDLWSRLRNAITGAISRATSGLGKVWDFITGKGSGGMALNINAAKSYGANIRGIQATLPQLQTAAAGGGTNLTINVNAPGTAAQDIALAVERVIVRRLTR
jgi:TP901 family phage tail tape measure protein